MMARFLGGLRLSELFHSCPGRRKRKAVSAGWLEARFRWLRLPRSTLQTKAPRGNRIHFFLDGSLLA